MPQYHMDKKVNAAVVRLLDELCEFERACGRKSTLILIPHFKDESIVMAQDGKPMDSSSPFNRPTHIFLLALHERGESV